MVFTIQIKQVAGNYYKEGNNFYFFFHSANLVEIQTKLPKVTIGNIDSHVWKSSKGVFSCAET